MTEDQAIALAKEHARRVSSASHDVSLSSEERYVRVVELMEEFPALLEKCGRKWAEAFFRAWQKELDALSASRRAGN